MFDKLIHLFAGLSDRLLPPLERVKHPELNPKGELTDAHGVELFLARDGHSLHRLDFRGPRRNHSIVDLESFLRYAKRHGAEDTSTIFCNDARFTLVIDDCDRPDIDHATMHLEPSTALKAWSKIAHGSSRNQIDFRDLIEDRAEDLVEQKLAIQLARFKRTSMVKYNSDLSDGTSYGFQVEEKDRAGSAKLPRRFEVEIPLFEGWPTKYRVSLTLKIGGDLGQAPNFACEFRDLEDARALAIQEMISHCDVSMNGKKGDGKWLVVGGAPSATRPLSESLDKTFRAPPASSTNAEAKAGGRY